MKPALIQDEIGMGLAEATQYKMVDQVYQAGLPVYLTLIRHAAQGSLLFADDTSIKILETTIVFQVRKILSFLII